GGTSRRVQINVGGTHEFSSAAAGFIPETETKYRLEFTATNDAGGALGADAIRFRLDGVDPTGSENFPAGTMRFTKEFTSPADINDWPSDNGRAAIGIVVQGAANTTVRFSDFQIFKVDAECTCCQVCTPVWAPNLEGAVSARSGRHYISNFGQTMGFLISSSRTPGAGAINEATHADVGLMITPGTPSSLRHQAGGNGERLNIITQGTGSGNPSVAGFAPEDGVKYRLEVTAVTPAGEPATAIRFRAPTAANPGSTYEATSRSGSRFTYEFTYDSSVYDRATPPDNDFFAESHGEVAVAIVNNGGVGTIVSYSDIRIYVADAICSCGDPTPRAEYDFMTSNLTGLIRNVDYLIDDVPVTAATGGIVPIQAAWFGKEVTIVRVGNEDSPQLLEIPTRPTEPTGLSKTNTSNGEFNGRITGATIGNEYQRVGAIAWLPVVSPTIAGLRAGTYHVRVPATADTFAGASAILVIDPSSRPANYEIDDESFEAYDITLVSGFQLGETTRDSINSPILAIGALYPATLEIEQRARETVLAPIVHTRAAGGNEDVIWSSSDVSIARVVPVLNSKNETTGFVIRGMNPGTATIRAAAAADPSFWTEMTVTVTAGTKAPSISYTITSPYDDIDWDTINQFKSANHVHTTSSDGSNTTIQVAEDHYNKGYHIVTYTDHTRLNATPDTPRTGGSGVETATLLTTARIAEMEAGLGRDGAAGMLFIPHTTENDNPRINVGGVLGSHHTNSYWSTAVPTAPGTNAREAYQAITNAGGIIRINHPGRYTLAHTMANWRAAFAISNNPAMYTPYVELYNEFPALIGMEIINKKDGESYGDRPLWDNILQMTAPNGRFVWGFSDDDSHANADIGFSYNLMLMTELSQAQARYAMESGAFFAVTRVDRQLGINPTRGTINFDHSQPVPTINEIKVDGNKITIDAEDTSRIIWIADGVHIVDTTYAAGKTIDLADHQLSVYSYVRATLVSDTGVLYTQPFHVQIAGDEHEPIELTAVGGVATNSFVTGAGTVTTAAGTSGAIGNIAYPNGVNPAIVRATLPSATRITVAGDSRTRFAPVDWDLSDVVYNPATTTVQSFVVNGTVMLIPGIANTADVNLNVTLNVTINAAIGPAIAPLAGFMSFGGAAYDEDCFDFLEFEPADFAQLAAAFAPFDAPAINIEDIFIVNVPLTVAPDQNWGGADNQVGWSQNRFVNPVTGQQANGTLMRENEMRYMLFEFTEEPGWFGIILQDGRNGVSSETGQPEGLEHVAMQRLFPAGTEFRGSATGPYIGELTEQVGSRFWAYTQRFHTDDTTYDAEKGVWRLVVDLDDPDVWPAEAYVSGAGDNHNRFLPHPGYNKTTLYASGHQMIIATDPGGLANGRLMDEFFGIISRAYISNTHPDLIPVVDEKAIGTHDVAILGEKVEFDTEDYKDLKLYFSYRALGCELIAARLQYSLDGGIEWTNISSSDGGLLNTRARPEVKDIMVILPPDTHNQESLTFRWIPVEVSDECGECGCVFCFPPYGECGVCNDCKGIIECICVCPPEGAEPTETITMWELEITPEFVEELGKTDASVGGVVRAGTPTLTYVDGKLQISGRSNDWVSIDVDLRDLDLLPNETYRMTVVGSTTGSDLFQAHFPLSGEGNVWNTPTQNGSRTGIVFEFDSVMPDINGSNQVADGHRIRVRTGTTANYTIESIIIEQLGRSGDCPCNCPCPDCNDGECTHSIMGPWKVITAAACSTTGLERRDCRSCEDHFETRILPVLGHSFTGAWTEDTPATCLTNGSQSRVCARSGCEEKQTDVILSTGHDWTDWSAWEDTANGQKSTRTCNTCDDEQVQTITGGDVNCNGGAHKFATDSSLELSTAATCDADGEEVFECQDCEAIRRTPTDRLICVPSALKTLAATCTVGGKNYTECTLCGDELSATPIAALGHDWDSNGDGTHTCENCDEKANCSPSTPGATCSTCGYKFPAVTDCAHSWSSWARIGSTNRESRTCSLCQEVEERNRQTGGGGGGGGGGGDEDLPPPTAITAGTGNIPLPAGFTIPRETVTAIIGTLPAAAIQATAAGARTVNFTAAQAGENALLVRINAAGEIEVVSAVAIGANGVATVNIPSAGSYLVIARKTGDITGTGEVTTADAIALLRDIAGITKLDAVQSFVANGKPGENTTADVLQILRFIAGLIEKI
ncbi:MAG: hypothetical protein FWD48_10640, partial [Oscillospiraceae bacterium]|nr:hypothetical protein [Oscillospiraceae bacterium]